jgi:aspartyl protease family protein
MLLGAWVAALGLLVVLFDRLFENEGNPNRAPVMTLSDDGVPQVVLKRNRAGHYVATGSINGEPVRFLVDTGATEVALPLPLARRLNLPLREGGLSKTANGTVRTWRTRLDRVDLGGLVATQVPASVLPGMEGDEVLLGMSYLKRLELIQRGGVLILRPHQAP